MDVLLQVIAAPVVLFGVIIDWVYSIVVIASNFFGWVFSVVSWVIKVVSAFFSALFNPVTVSVSEIKGVVGEAVGGVAAGRSVFGVGGDHRDAGHEGAEGGAQFAPIDRRQA